MIAPRVSVPASLYWKSVPTSNSKVEAAASLATLRIPSSYWSSPRAMVENARPLVWVNRCSTVIARVWGWSKAGSSSATRVSSCSLPSSSSIWTTVPVSGLVIERTQ